MGLAMDPYRVGGAADRSLQDTANWVAKFIRPAISTTMGASSAWQTKPTAHHPEQL